MSSVQGSPSTPGPGTVTGTSIAQNTVTGGATGNIALNTISSVNMLDSYPDATLTVVVSVVCSGGSISTTCKDLTVANGIITAIGAGYGC